VPPGFNRSFSTSKKDKNILFHNKYNFAPSSNELKIESFGSLSRIISTIENIKIRPISKGE